MAQTRTIKRLGRGIWDVADTKLEINIKRLSGKSKSFLFCKKYEELVTPLFAQKHGCLKPKNLYVNKEGKAVAVFCPNLMTLKGELFYKEYSEKIYESLEGIFTIFPKFKDKLNHAKLKREDKEGIFKKQEKNLRKILELKGRSVFE